MQLTLTAIGYHVVTLTAVPNTGNAPHSFIAEVLLTNGLRPLAFHLTADGRSEVVCERMRHTDGSFVSYHYIGLDYYV